MSEKLWCLKRCNLFDQLSPDQLQRIERSSRARKYPARSPIYLPAESAESVFLLAKGLVKVSNITGDGKESTLAFVEPGELFGELAIFDGQQRDEFVKAVVASTVLMIPTREMHQLMSERADIALGITKIVCLRRQRVERRLKNLLFLSIRDRLIHLLLDLAEQFGYSTENGIRLRIKFSHQELANLIGSTRETVTVALGQLKKEGYIESGRRTIVLTKPERLARSVQRQLPPPTPRQSPRLSLALA